MKLIFFFKSFVKNYQGQDLSCQGSVRSADLHALDSNKLYIFRYGVREKGLFHRPLRSLHFLVIAFLLYFVAGCSSAMREKLIDAQYYFDRGTGFMEKKAYMKAITEFQTVVESFPASEIVSRAQFMLAEATFMNEDYLTAAYDYERLYSDFPSSEHVPEARYKKALCYYQESPKAALDQENTLLAVDEFNRFIDNYPRHELAKEAQNRIEELRAKLAYKMFKSAELYRKQKKYEASIIYYRFVIIDYPRTDWADEARYGLGLIYLKQKNYEKAKETYQLLVNTNVSEDLKDKASKKLSYIENRAKSLENK